MNYKEIIVVGVDRNIKKEEKRRQHLSLALTSELEFVHAVERAACAKVWVQARHLTV